MAYDRLDPIGGERGDLQAGIIAAVQANVWKGKGDTLAKPIDFCPDWGGLRKASRRRQTMAEQMAAAKSWTAFHGGEIR